MAELTRERPLRWRPRVSLRALLVLTGVLAVAVGWLEHSVSGQRRAVQAVRAAGGYVNYRSQLQPVPPGQGTPLPAPRWLLDLLGWDYFDSPEKVVLPPASPSVLNRLAEKIGGLDRVTTLTVTPLSVPQVLEPPEPFDASQPAALAEFGGALAKLPALTQLNLNEYPAPIANAFFERLRASSSIEELALTGLTLEPGAAAIVAALPRLTQLDLRYWRLTDESPIDVGNAYDDAVGELVAAEQLEGLSLGTRRLTAAGYANIRRIERLKSLYLVGEASKRHYLDCLYGLDRLSALFIDHGALASGSLTTFADLPKLEFLSLRVDDLGDNDRAELARLTGLWFLDLEGVAVDYDAIDAVSSLTDLHTLSLNRGDPWWSQEAEDRLRRRLPDTRIHVYTTPSRPPAYVEE